MKNSFFLTFVLSLICLGNIFAQKGTLTGTVIDDEFSEPLIGANVIIESLGTGTSTDFDGKYQYQLDPGTYTVICSYIGFTDQKFENIEIKADEITYLDVILGSGAIQLEEAIVTAKAIERTEVALLMLQKKSDKIQDGISSQEMNRYGVGNAAAALQKVTGTTVSEGKYIYVRGLGDRYSIAQLNGMTLPSTDPYRNSAQLDLIPTNLLDNIVTSKTFTPDQPGTFTGGNVNIKTKSLPEQFSLNISVSTEFNAQNNLIDNFLTHQGGRNDYWGFDDGYRALPESFSDETFRSLLNKESERNARKRGDVDAANALDQSIKSLNRQYTPTEKSTPLDHGFGLSFGNQYTLFGKPLGVTLAGSFKQSYQHLGGFQKANWRVFDIDGDALFNQGDFADTQSTETPTLNGLAGLALKISPTDEISFNMIYNHNAEKLSRTVFGERPDNITNPRFLSGRQLSFVERQLINYQVNGTHVLKGLNNLKIEWIASKADSKQDEPQTRFFENVYNSETDQSTLPASDIQLPFYFFRTLVDEQYSGKVDITIPFGQSNSKLKVGGMYTTKDRNFVEDRFQIISTPFAGGFNGNTEEYLSDENVGIVEYDEDRDQYSIGNYLVDDTNPNNSYLGNEDVLAAYGMLTYQLTQKLKLIAGARIEQTDIFVESKAFTLPDSVRIGSIESTDVLPSLNLIYELNDEMNLRGSFSQTLARPNMREIAPFVSFDPLEKFFFIGNPSLQKTNIDNGDIRCEWFYNTGDMIAVSGYYKNFKNPITQQYRNSSNPEIEFANVENGNLFGLELEVRKDLEQLVPALRNFKVNGNFTLIKSSLSVNDVSGFEPDDRPFQGQPPFIVNAALNYFNREAGWDVTLGYNVVGDRLQIIGRNGTPDIYDRSRGQLDFSLIKMMGDMQVKLSAKNLLNDSYTLSSTFKENEFIYSTFKRGISIGLGLSYTIR